MSNPGFETAGGRDGAADSWAVLQRARASLTAAYGHVGTIEQTNFTTGYTSSGLTGTAQSLAAPNGGAAASAALLVPANTNANHRATSNATVAVATNDRVVFGCYLQRQGSSAQRAAALLIASAGQNVYVSVDLTTGRVLASAASNVDFAAPCVTVTDADPVGGWMLVEVSTIAKGALTLSFIVALTDAAGALVFTPAALDGIGAWGAFVTLNTQEDTETFGAGWSNDSFTDVIVSSSAASYDTITLVPLDHEDFEHSWSNDPFLPIITTAVQADYDTVPEGFEDFEEGWLNDSFILTISSSVTATYDAAPEGFEDFEEGWGNDAYQLTISSSTAATYAEVDAFESFERVLDDVEVTPDETADIFTKLAHGLTLNTRLFVSVHDGGSYPTVLDKSFLYFAVSIFPDFFQIARTASGAAVDFTSNGDLVFFRGDPAVFWNGPDFNRTI